MRIVLCPILDQNVFNVHMQNSHHHSCWEYMSIDFVVQHHSAKISATPYTSPLEKKPLRLRMQPSLPKAVLETLLRTWWGLHYEVSFVTSIEVYFTPLSSWKLCELKKCYIFKIASPVWLQFYQIRFPWVYIHGIYYILDNSNHVWWSFGFFIKHTISNWIDA